MVTQSKMLSMKCRLTEIKGLNAWGRKIILLREKVESQGGWKEEMKWFGGTVSFGAGERENESPEGLVVESTNGSRPPRL